MINDDEKTAAKTQSLKEKTNKNLDSLSLCGENNKLLKFQYTKITGYVNADNRKPTAVL